VVSAVSACDYLGNVFELDALLASILLLTCFAALTLMGLRESATIAFAIWIVHVLTLSVLALGCLAYAASEGFGILMLNKDEPLPPLHMAGNDLPASVTASLFLGFSSAMLGVSGYETTAQCIENMQTPTFLRVLKHLWVGSSLINPTLAFLAISVLPIAEISANRYDRSIDRQIDKSIDPNPGGGGGGWMIAWIRRACNSSGEGLGQEDKATKKNHPQPTYPPTHLQTTHTNNYSFSDTVLAKMTRTWGDWAFGEGSRMSQLMADWMSIEAFIVLSGMYGRCVG
jgi:hypothetical protein